MSPKPNTRKDRRSPSSYRDLPAAGAGSEIPRAQLVWTGLVALALLAVTLFNSGQATATRSRDLASQDKTSEASPLPELLRER